MMAKIIETLHLLLPNAEMLIAQLKVTFILGYV